MIKILKSQNIVLPTLGLKKGLCLEKSNGNAAMKELP